MIDGPSVALAALIFTIISAVAGFMVRKLGKIENHISTVSNRLEQKVSQIANNVATQLNTHENRDQERHVETIQRLTRLETTVLDNGHGRKRVAAGRR